ncbi:hypothetical protein KVV02_000246 [Mortierella alpina]|uniref:HIG1 domain-containing protein n=1 Tax=Mortierella alpina TaxID=64518 RepID=A0A9P8II30_MORAP|nr:hypothetical protein KVV02_000246 [Mortierella alpina]
MSDDQYFDEDTETAMEKVKRLFRENKVVSAGKSQRVKSKAWRGGGTFRFQFECPTRKVDTGNYGRISWTPTEALHCRKISVSNHLRSYIHSYFTGVGLTIAAFIGASYGVRSGRREFAQHMFRARVGFQFFTLAALLGGGMFYDNKRKEERLALEQSRMVALEQQEKNV